MLMYFTFDDAKVPASPTREQLEAKIDSLNSMINSYVDPDDVSFVALEDEDSDLDLESDSESHQIVVIASLEADLKQANKQRIQAQDETSKANKFRDDTSIIAKNNLQKFERYLVDSQNEKAMLTVQVEEAEKQNRLASKRYSSIQKQIDEKEK
ncbi:hypothetical protein ScalyP_jg7979, partial [Parmales sp. scaly parma]